MNEKTMTRLCNFGLFVMFLFLLGVASGRILSWDLFWQLHSGRYMWETGTLIERDIFSLASEVFRHEHCWLHDLIFYGVYALGGYKGISLLKGVLLLLTGISLVATARLRGTSQIAVLATFPLFFGLTSLNWYDRPQLWTFLLFAVSLLVFERQLARGGRAIYLLLPLTALWANLHAGALLVFPILLAYFAGILADRFICKRTFPPGFRHVALASLLTPLAFLLAPTDQIKYLFGALTAASQGQASGAVTLMMNLDWAPWTLGHGIYYPLCVAAAFLVLLPNWRHLTFRDLFLLAGLAFMGFRLIRHIPFFLFACTAILPLYLDGLREKALVVRHAFIRYAFALCVLLGTVWIGKTVWGQYGFFDMGIRSWRYPVGAAEFVRSEKPPGNIFHNFEWGGYLMWKLFPDYRVFWDGRQNSSEMFILGNKIVGGEPEKDEILNRFDINTIILSPVHNVTGGRQAKILDPLRRDPAWVLVYAGESDVVFARASAMEPLWLQKNALPDFRVDDVILSLTSKLLEESPYRFKAYGERAKIFLERRDLRRAFEELEMYVSLAPPERADPEAVKIYYALRDRFSRMP